METSHVLNQSPNHMLKFTTLILVYILLISPFVARHEIKHDCCRFLVVKIAPFKPDPRMVKIALRLSLLAICLSLDSGSANRREVTFENTYLDSLNHLPCDLINKKND